MSQRDDFDVAGNGDDVKLSNLAGKLVLFAPTEWIECERDAQGNAIGGGILTKEYGRKDAIVADLVVIDGDDGPEEYDDVRIFNTKIFGPLKRRIGRKYLAVVAWGPKKIKGNFPLLLNPPTEAQVQMATDYVAGRTVKAALPDMETEDPFAVK